MTRSTPRGVLARRLQKAASSGSGGGTGATTTVTFIVSVFLAGDLVDRNMNLLSILLEGRIHTASLTP
jgi:hypothetical protein